MPLQNRVTPFGDIVAVDARGLFTGNRGIIHDPATRTLTSRRWTSKAWITCACEYKGIRRAVMAQRSWTELFFLDEATALAAGHRPCFLCRREAAEAFRGAWSVGNRVDPPLAATMDAKLHAERLDRGRKRLHALKVPLEDLPDGAMVASAEAAYLLANGLPYLWSPFGYQRAAKIGPVDGVLTPPSMLAALAAGYSPVLHPSAGC
ncbi:hypothetical protein IB238_10510 [Rhizobium sp. ARZ01]|uniref:hypothetical protein n=1 Tax=Rhizobium sp. ARZ01 TaxID=2769313 RepID=UPI001785C9D0|nr:hypothetical protein [Rhizobium sp. ARZ01]MBD9373051.1 hypothetical protein [Rhizobium sp. ARZ01]